MRLHGFGSGCLLERLKMQQEPPLQVAYRDSHPPKFSLQLPEEPFAH